MYKRQNLTLTLVRKSVSPLARCIVKCDGLTSGHNHRQNPLLYLKLDVRHHNANAHSVCAVVRCIRRHLGHVTVHRSSVDDVITRITRNSRWNQCINYHIIVIRTAKHKADKYSVVTKALVVETEAEARGSYLILLAVPHNHLQLDLSVIYSGLGAVSLIRQQQQQKPN